MFFMLRLFLRGLFIARCFPTSIIPYPLKKWRGKRRASETVLVSSAGRYPSRLNDRPPFHCSWIDMQI